MSGAGLRSVVLLLAAIVAGGGAGAWLVLRVTGTPAPGPPASVRGSKSRGTDAPGLDPRLARALRAAREAARHSHFLEAVRGSTGLPEAWSCTLVSPREEHVPPGANGFHLVPPGEHGYESSVGPYVDVFGRIDLHAPAQPPFTREVAVEVERVWRNVKSLVGGPVTDPPVRVLVKHYPRPDLPGRCFTLDTVFYTVPDPYLDPTGFKRSIHRENGHRSVRGLIFSIRKTVQAGAGAPRVVEAVVEAHDHIGVDAYRKALVHYLGRDAVLPDGGETSHFEEFGQGSRRGIAWTDLAAGVGEPRPNGIAFRIEDHPGAAQPIVREEDAPEEVVEALLALAGRA